MAGSRYLNLTPLRHLANDGAALWRCRRDLSRYGTAYLNFWSQPPVPETWFYRFLRRPALRPYLGRRNIVWLSVFGRRRLSRVCPGDIKIFYTGENVANRPVYADHLLDRVDLSLGFDRIDHPRYLRFPVWLLECFDPLDRESDIRRRLQAWDEAAADRSYRQPEACLIARHDRGGIRARMADHFPHPVVYAGAFRNNTGGSIAPGREAKLALLRKLTYNICPENSDRPGYVTEKLFDAFAAGCIPVYWGSGNAPEPAIFRREAIMFYDPPTHAFSARTRVPSAFQPEAAEVIYGYFHRLEQKLIELLAN